MIYLFDDSIDKQAELLFCIEDLLLNKAYIWSNVKRQTIFYHFYAEEYFNKEFLSLWKNSSIGSSWLHNVSLDNEFKIVVHQFLTKLFDCGFEESDDESENDNSEDDTDNESDSDSEDD